MRAVTIPFFSIALAFLSSSCSDTERLDRLEADIRAIKADTRDEVDSIRTRVDAMDGGGGSSGGEIGARMNSLESRLAEVMEAQGVGSDTAYLRPGVRGHAPMETDHGIFLIRLEGIDLNVGGQGFTVHLEIGNLNPLMINQFVLKGDFGGNPPQLSPDEDPTIANHKIAEWQQQLKPFDLRVTKPLTPMTWTPVDVVLDTTSREDLALMRFSMVIENAQLEGTQSSSSSAGGPTLLTVGSDAASVAKTDYGAFLIVVSGSESRGSGTKIDLEIGNPYGFSINQCRLVGEFGPPIPQRRVGEGQPEYLGRISEWTAQLKPFNAQIDTKLDPFRWNSASILVPGSVSDVKSLRAQLRIENVTLPQASESYDNIPKFTGKKGR